MFFLGYHFHYNLSEGQNLHSQKTHFISDLTPVIFRVRLMLGNIEELRDYHKHVMLPKMETAVDNAAIMR